MINRIYESNHDILTILIIISQLKNSQNIFQKKTIYKKTLYNKC